MVGPRGFSGLRWCEFCTVDDLRLALGAATRLEVLTGTIVPGKPSLTDPTECSRGTRWLGYGELQACLYEDSGRAVLLKDPVEFMNEPGGFYVHTRFDVEVRDHDASNPLPSSFNCP